MPTLRTWTAALRAYFELARSVIERFGGVVEKFIGDAVVGLFGVPAAHEDDAERAVRAALEIVAHCGELPPVVDEGLQVRAAGTPDLRWSDSTFCQGREKACSSAMPSTPRPAFSPRLRQWPWWPGRPRIG